MLVPVDHLDPSHPRADKRKAAIALGFARDLCRESWAFRAPGLESRIRFVEFFEDSVPGSPVPASALSVVAPSVRKAHA